MRVTAAASEVQFCTSILRYLDIRNFLFLEDLYYIFIIINQSFATDDTNSVSLLTMRKLSLTFMQWQVWLWIGWLTFSTSQTFQKCYSTPSTTEIQALETLYTSTNGVNWNWKPASVGKQWDFSGSSPNPCDSWQGIVCLPTNPTNNNTCVVSILTLDGYDLVGSLPNAIGGLANLNFLQISSNARLTGRIPDSIGYQMSKLIALALFSNDLTGSIPSSITNLTTLHLLYLFENQFYGQLPTSLNRMVNLTEVDLDSNHLSGPLSPSIAQLPQLAYLYLFDNDFTGEIPLVFGNLSQLIELVLHTNYLSGSLPNTFRNLSHLQICYLHNNNLHGSIDDALQGLESLTQVDFDHNQFSGSIPSTFSALANLTMLRLSQNSFTGSVALPSSMKEVDISKNWLTGDVHWMTNCSKALTLVVADNVFTGSLPTYRQLSPQLTYFQVQDNLLTGNIHELFDASIQYQLQFIDLSKNSLTGSIPSSLFQFPNITYLILAQNCFTGSIPQLVCDSKETLQVLAMDGLHAAVSCQQRLFLGIPQIHTLVNTHAIVGSIPSCLFGEMKRLEILHISGNALTGSLPDSYETISGKLQQLSLSHNALEGTIPLAFQQHGFLKLDLSFNKLTGELKESMNITGYNQYSNESTGLSLNNNRLSGSLPSIVLDLAYVNILAGNMFSCDAEDRDKTLPQHDTEFHTYMCGSDETNVTMICYVVVVLVMVVVTWAMLWWARQSEPGDSPTSTTQWTTRLKQFCNRTSSVVALAMMDASSIDTLVSPDSEDEAGNKLTEATALLLRYVHRLQTYLMHLIAVVVFVFLLVYGLLGAYFSTFEHKYIWSVSIGYLSGYAPAGCLLVVMLILLGLLFVDGSPCQLVLPPVIVVSKEADNTKTTPNMVKEGQQSDGGHWKRTLTLLLLVNVVTVMTINSSYVSLIISGISTVDQIILTICMSFFKDGWRFLVLNAGEWNVMKTMEAQWGAERVTILLLAICLFNNVLAPCLAIAMVNTNCFYYALVPAPNVEYSNDSIGFCASVYANKVCASYESIDISTSYQPTFTYSYQCTSTLLSVFVPVWIYMFLFGSIVLPMLTWVLYLLVEVEENHHQTAAKKLIVMQDFQFFTLLRHRIWLYFNPQSYLLVCRLDDYKKQVVMLCNSIAIVLIFGVLFPPLAVVGCIAIVVQLRMQKVLLLQMWKTCRGIASVATATNGLAIEEAKQWQNCIQQHIQDITTHFSPTYVHTMRNVVLYVSIVWGVFLWDIVGDTEGLLPSMWILFLMGTVGLLLRFQQFFRRQKSKDAVLQSVDIECQEFHSKRPNISSNKDSNSNRNISSSNSNSSNSGEVVLNPILQEQEQVSS